MTHNDAKLLDYQFSRKFCKNIISEIQKIDHIILTLAFISLWSLFQKHKKAFLKWLVHLHAKCGLLYRCDHKLILFTQTVGENLDLICTIQKFAIFSSLIQACIHIYSNYLSVRKDE